MLICASVCPRRGGAAGQKVPVGKAAEAALSSFRCAFSYASQFHDICCDIERRHLAASRAVAAGARSELHASVHESIMELDTLFTQLRQIDCSDSKMG